MTYRVRLPLVAAAAVGLLAMVVPAWAGPAVTLNLGAVELDQPALPGGQYRLPTLTVHNPGDAAAGYTVAAIAVTGNPEATADWFRLSPPRFHLPAGGAHNVRVQLRPPVGAPAGKYQVLLTARLEAPSGAGAAAERIGAAVASRVTFKVAPASRLSGWAQVVGRWLNDTSPWPQTTAALAVVATGIRMLSRRLRIKVARRPAPGASDDEQLASDLSS